MGINPFAGRFRVERHINRLLRGTQPLYYDPKDDTGYFPIPETNLFAVVVCAEMVIKTVSEMSPEKQMALARLMFKPWYYLTKTARKWAKHDFGMEDDATDFAIDLTVNQKLIGSVPAWQEKEHDYHRFGDTDLFAIVKRDENVIITIKKMHSLAQALRS